MVSLVMSKEASTEKASEIFKEARKHTTAYGIYAIDFANLAIYDQLVSLEATTSLLEALETLSPSETVTKLLNHSRRRYQKLIEQHKL